MKNKLLKFILFIAIHSFIGLPLHAMNMLDTLRDMYRAGNNAANDIHQEIAKLQKQQATLRDRIEAEYQKEKPDQNHIIILQKDLDNIQVNINNLQVNFNKAFNFELSIVETASNELKSDKVIEEERKRELAKASIEHKEKGKAVVEQTKAVVDAITNFAKQPRNVATLSGGVALAAAGIATAYYGGKLTFNYIDSKLRKPTLIQKTSIKTLSQKIRDFIFGAKKEKNRFEEIKLDAELEFKIQEIAASLEDNIANGQGVYHVLLTGTAGTGKTMFSEALAQRLAHKNIRYKGKKVPVNYMMCAGGDFAQFSSGEDITEFHKIVDYANNAEGITILFIDEIDSLLKNRADSRTTDAGTNRTTTFLSLFDKPSHPKIMILGGTNYPERIDHAALTRFSKKVKFKLPTGETLKQIFEQYLNSEVLAKKLVIDATFRERQQELVTAMQGLAPRTIEDVMKQAYYRARFMKTTLLTYDMLKSLIDDAHQAEKLTAPAA